MSASSDKIIVYVKGNNNTEVKARDVRIKDMLSIACADSNVENHINVLKIVKFPEKGQHRTVVSILKVIQCIHEKYPNIQVVNLGPTDLIVTYEDKKQKYPYLEYVKVGILCVLVFCGAAFSIMSFNNDISLTNLFGQIYRLIMGKESDGFTLLEISYSVGISLGILIFFNHFGKKRFSVDPTPMEVEMRLYENDIESTLVDIYARKGKEVDVDGNG